ncbi:MAG: Bacterial/Archaeal Transporter family protein [Polyangiaceae bacterium]|nr:Bacterial/Archaeal Transporter family protein [Polyangiaceae bacterium]
MTKLGVAGVPAALATVVRTAVVLVFAVGIALAGKQHHVLGSLRGKALLFLVLSGIATGASWLAYFKALQLGPASRVAPLDKLSLPFTVALGALLLGEPVTGGSAPVRRSWGLGHYGLFSCTGMCL